LSKLGIIAALPAEADCLTKKILKVGSPVEIQKDIYLCLSGIGYDAAQHSSKRLLELNVDALISWGVAGSIESSLKSGDLLLARKIINNTNSWTINPNWISNCQMQLASTSINTVNADIASSNDMCASVNDKNNLSIKTGALAVDMESAAIAELASENNIDFLVVRAIADDADTNIPKAVLEHTDTLGRPDIVPFILSCISDPKQIKELWKLAKCYKQALNTLKLIAPDLKKQHFLYTSQK
jgi:adenosylhomocysteine nucleosidase